MTALEVLLEIMKLSIPGLVVFATVYYLMKELTQQWMLTKQVEQVGENKRITVPLRLQAYERLSLYCERISIPSLLLRLRSENKSVQPLKWALLQAIQQEFEHNITQQIYVSETLWRILMMAKDTEMEIIDQVAESLPKEATVDDYIKALFDFIEKQEKDPIRTALTAIKKEASTIL